MLYILLDCCNLCLVMVFYDNVNVERFFKKSLSKKYGGNAQDGFR